MIHANALIHTEARSIWRRPATWAALGLAACLLWSWWPTIVELVQFWSRNQDYSVGILVAPVAIYLAWRRRASLAALPARPCWWGAGLLVLAELIRFGGVYFGYGSAERYALVCAIAGVTLLVAGWSVFWRLKWVLAFLLLMVPLPARAHEAVAIPLQNGATASAVFGLELLGFFVLREGNVIRLENGHAVAVAEACSGLRMLTAFVVVAAVLVLLFERPRWHKAVIMLCSVPIAVLSNSIRVIATSLFVHYSGSALLTDRFHEAAGLAMMPLAIVFSIGLLMLLGFLSTPKKQPSSTFGAPRTGNARSKGHARHARPKRVSSTPVR